MSAEFTGDFLAVEAEQRGAVLPVKNEPVEIPNVGRETLGDWCRKLNFKVGVEVGVQRGEFSEVLCRTAPAMELHCVDPWLVRPSYYDRRGQRLFDRFEEDTRRRLTAFPNAHIIKATSMEAVGTFAPRSIDFVYIDGHHNLVNVVNDIHEWSVRVRPGGIIAGHDYARYRGSRGSGMHVMQAVRAYVDAYDIAPWYVLGRQANDEGLVRDKYRSFAWVRPRRETNMASEDPTDGGLAEMPV